MITKCSLVLPRHLQETILRHLFPGDSDEHALVILAGVADFDGHRRLLAREVVVARDGIDSVPGRYGYKMMKAEFIQPLIRRCRKERLAYISVHNHGGEGSVAFSQADLTSHERGYPALLDLAGGMPVGAAVYARGAIAGDIWMPDGTRMPLDETRVLGINIERLYDSPRSKHAANSPFHTRQLLMFGEAGQAKLAQARVGVIGAGGVGSLLVEYLARLGVGTIVVVDDDRISLSNLSRVVGATRWDARYPFSLNCMPKIVREFAERHSAKKVKVAQRNARRANPNCNVERIDGDFADPSCANQFLGCDFLFLAADSMRARLLFNAIAQQYYIPGIQIGTKITSQADAKSLDDAFSVERWVLPSCNCLWCSGMISPHLLAVEAKSPEERKDQDYGTLEANPSVITMNAIGASMAANDFMMSLLGLHDEAAAVTPRRVKHLSRATIHETYPADPDCPECSATDGSRLGKGNAAELPTLLPS
ncbi:ThiF family adenylyltransferase [Burkholderia vietnamiensis]|uniref:UBA/THIF-type NAD/FAD binding protein n=1 Tax=Burkholderia vietnamiensis (strain G4 / LMG 22486) TaxID=269482 RepID=A4JAH9_BURVG|nr:ThiF family adenylyltransferase [Burkholderia vietnamiensis]ABO53282.1 UBA/THIF-type NAD/FAD binding protein [Burkholderia vietnamiensis G4]MCB4346318.1 ThiF family adenylyltransferase [Burkholderia vietnamiensis]